MAKIEKLQQHKNELESLHQVFLGIKLLYECVMPKGGYILKDRYFNFFIIEMKKVLYGKLIILLSDNKYKKYNTSSYKILIQKIMENKKLIGDKEKRKMECYLKGLNKVEGDYKEFRDKYFAHMELDEEFKLLDIERLKISNHKITKLMKKVERIHNRLSLVIYKGSSDHLAGDIGRLSQKIWSAYEQVGLVEKDT